MVNNKLEHFCKFKLIVTVYSINEPPLRNLQSKVKNLIEEEIQKLSKNDEMTIKYNKIYTKC